VPWWLLADAERQLSSSMTGLLLAVSPIIAVVVARLTGDTERLGATRTAGLAVGLAGVLVLAAPGLRGGNVRSVVEVLLVATCYATARLIVARRLTDVPGLPMTAVCLGLAALVYAPAAVATWPDAMPSGQVVAALAGLGIICTATPFVGLILGGSVLATARRRQLPSAGSAGSTGSKTIPSAGSTSSSRPPRTTNATW
jgi:drug/metabolite transporter (DMT)-like permease